MMKEANKMMQQMAKMMMAHHSKFDVNTCVRANVIKQQIAIKSIAKSQIKSSLPGKTENTFSHLSVLPTP